jgi:UDP-N-acetyl-D-mannosaminuronic acid transferase (WecB/TagA/CpsF family)
MGTQISERQNVKVLTASIDVVDWEQAIWRVQQWAVARQSRYVCICNVHSVVSAGKDLACGVVVSQADMGWRCLVTNSLFIVGMLRQLLWRRTYK